MLSTRRTTPKPRSCMAATTSPTNPLWTVPTGSTSRRTETTPSFLCIHCALFLSLEANPRRTRRIPWSRFPTFRVLPCSSWTIGAFPSIPATHCLLSPLPRRTRALRKQYSTSRPRGPPPRRKRRAFRRSSLLRILALPRVPWAPRCTRRHWNRGNTTKTWLLRCCNGRRACSFWTLPQRRCCTRWRFLCMNLYKWFIRSERLATSQK